MLVNQPYLNIQRMVAFAVDVVSFVFVRSDKAYVRAVNATKHRWKPWQNINNFSNILQTVDIWVKCYPEFQIGSFRARDMLGIG